MDQSQVAPHSITYTLQLSDKERSIIEGVVKVLASEEGLVRTLTRALDQMTFMCESFDRMIKKQEASLTELSDKRAKETEELKKAQSAQLSAINNINKRLKDLESVQKAPWRDNKSKPHNKGSQQRVHHIEVQPTTSEVKDEGAVTTNKEVKNNEEKFSNTSLKEQVQKLAAGTG